MLRQPRMGLAIALLLFSHVAGVRADDKNEFERVKFDTADFVEIHGKFYAGGGGGKSACVILLHQIGANSQQEGWNELAGQLKNKGFSVLSFDFRGHGDSTTVGPAFWKYPPNQSLRSYRPGKLKDEISYKDFTTIYNYADMVNDIAAAKRFLDRRNDAGDCNSSNIILVGAESGATIGLFWTWCEYHIRPVQFAFPLMQNSQKVEGEDISCAIWLSMSSYLAPPNRYHVELANWLRSPVPEKVPMYFLYGADDSKSARLAETTCKNILRAGNNPKTKWTGKRAIANTKLAGAELLGKSLGTSDDILNYINKVMEDHAFNASIKRDVDRQFPTPIPVDRLFR